ncbi:unnamed protein product [Wuchereria bancrofti]|uniref:Uncharacterized protein n=2 Tax=Wuchereria bancrofti TaxID=6293 RepID=A0A3P7E1N5_WUCBA|nr:unnamed protein product [Wuchereria bancrofti]
MMLKGAEKNPMLGHRGPGVSGFLTQPLANLPLVWFDLEPKNDIVYLMVPPKLQSFEEGTPGHVFPIIANDGGVLARNGHTEASVEIAGFPCHPVIIHIHF